MEFLGDDPTAETEEGCGSSGGEGFDYFGQH